MAYDPWAETQPSQSRNSFPEHHRPTIARPPAWMRRRRRRIGCGCACTPFLGGLLIAILVLFSVYAFAPIRTNLLVLGIDYAPAGNATSRSDTIIMATIIPTGPKVATL